MLHDEIGPWSEVKLDILKKYASAYSTILSRQGLYHVYIDAFAGSGQHFSRTSREMVPGSPFNALIVRPPFKEYHFPRGTRMSISIMETAIVCWRKRFFQRCAGSSIGVDSV